MQRTLLPLLLLVCAGFWVTSEAYTVIFKTGKVLQGTLISDTEDSIVFKDDHGIQYSLKKKSLDWDKMTDTNSAPPPTVVNAPPASENETPPVPPPDKTKKSSRVYTMKDIETVREKFGGVGADTDKGNVPMAGTVTPETYLPYLKDASARIGTAMAQLNSLLDGLATAWEVASSTGKDPSASIKEYKTGKAAADILKTVNNLMSTLDAYKEVLAENPPKEYQTAFQGFTESVKGLEDALNMIQQYDSKQNMTTFRNRVTEIFVGIQPRIESLQAMEPATTTPAPTVTPAPEGQTTPEKTEENQNSDQNQSQTSPETSDQPPPGW